MTTFPYGRPKPPRIWGGGWRRDLYEVAYPSVLTIFSDRYYPLWVVWSQGHESHTFPTHAEAINWAQKHAHNRNESGGEISGA